MEISLVGLPANPAAVRAWEIFGLDLTNTTTRIRISPEVLIRSGADVVRHELSAPIFQKPSRRAWILPAEK